MQYTIIEESTIRKKSYLEFTDKHLAKSVCAKIDDNVLFAFRIMLSETKAVMIMMLHLINLLKDIPQLLRTERHMLSLNHLATIYKSTKMM